MGAAGHAEIEVKYAVDERAVMPDLVTVPGAVTAVRLEPMRLEAVYFDTADRVLVRARIALRRRTGGHDAGWHVKLPAAVGRTELQAPIDPDRPDVLPDVLRELIATRVRTAPLEPIARIATERIATVLRDAGAGAVEVVDDRVTATDIAAGVVRTWREWEVEQVGDDADASAALLAATDPVLQAAGARVSPSPAKLAQALGGERTEAAAPAATAGEVVRRIVARLTEQLHRDVAALRSGGADQVHAARKTIRRIRSMLALEDVTGEAGMALRQQLRSLGATLGDARDPAVAARVSAELLDGLGDDVPDAARRRLVDERLADAEAARVRALGALDSPVGSAVFAALDGFVAATPTGPHATAPVPALADLARSTAGRAVRRTKHAGRSMQALHEARRAAKRSRYVIEELETEGALRDGSALRRAAKRAAAVHDAVGAHRDLQLVVADLPFVAARATANGENAFVYGVLAERGARQASRLRRTAKQAMKRLRAVAR